MQPTLHCDLQVYFIPGAFQGLKKKKMIYVYSFMRSCEMVLWAYEMQSQAVMGFCVFGFNL